MQISLLDPASHGMDVTTEVLPSELRDTIFSKNVWRMPVDVQTTRNRKDGGFGWVDERAHT